MTPTTEEELLATIADNTRQIRLFVEHLGGPISTEDWQSTLDQIVELRKAQKALEAKLDALKK